jgi:hypothetical protein
MKKSIYQLYFQLLKKLRRGEIISEVDINRFRNAACSVEANDKIIINIFNEAGDLLASEIIDSSENYSINLTY